MYSAVIGRVRELAMLQTLGFSRRAIALSILQEGTLLATAGAGAALVASLLLINGVAVRISMGAFTMSVDHYAMVAGLGIGTLIGLIGSAPPAWHAMQMPVGEALKAI
jgi:ABC-type antimicrobial peptide transport system permease subunit